MLIIERDHIFNARATMSTSSTFLPPKSMAIKTFMNTNFRCRSTWDEATFRSTFVSASASHCQRHCVSASASLRQRLCVSASLRLCVSVTASLRQRHGVSVRINCVKRRCFNGTEEMRKVINCGKSGFFLTNSFSLRREVNWDHQEGQQRCRGGFVDASMTLVLPI